MSNADRGHTICTLKMFVIHTITNIYHETALDGHFSFLLYFYAYGPVQDRRRHWDILERAFLQAMSSPVGAGDRAQVLQKSNQDSKLLRPLSSPD